MSPFPISPPPKHGRQMCLDARRILTWRLVFLSSTCTRPPSLASFYSVRPPRSRQNNINCRHPRPQSAQTICTRSAKERARRRPSNTPIARSLRRTHRGLVHRRGCGCDRVGEGPMTHTPAHDGRQKAEAHRTRRSKLGQLGQCNFAAGLVSHVALARDDVQFDDRPARSRKRSCGT